MSLLIYFSLIISNTFILLLKRSIVSQPLVVFFLFSLVAAIAYATGEIGYDVHSYNRSFSGEGGVGANLLTAKIFTLLVIITNGNPDWGRSFLIGVSGIAYLIILRGKPIKYLGLVYALMLPLLWGNFKLQLSVPAIFLFLHFSIAYYNSKTFVHIILGTLFLFISILVHSGNVILIPFIFLIAPLSVFFVIPISFLIYSSPLIDYFDVFAYVTERIQRYIFAGNVLVNPWYQRIIEVGLNLILFFYYLKNRLPLRELKPFILCLLLFHAIKATLNIFDFSSHIQGRALLPYYAVETFVLIKAAVYNRRLRYNYLLTTYLLARLYGYFFGSFRYAVYG